MCIVMRNVFCVMQNAGCRIYISASRNIALKFSCCFLPAASGKRTVMKKEQFLLLCNTTPDNAFKLVVAVGAVAYVFLAQI